MQRPRRRMDGASVAAMMSLRRTALIWMTLMLALVGATAMLISYRFARIEASGFLDNQLRQIALNAGEGLPDTAGPPVEHDPEDEFVVTLWDANGRMIRSSPPGIDVPRQPRVGFSNLSAAGDHWRVYTSSDGARTVQIAQRISVREELAAAAAIGAAAPILAVIPLSWLLIGWATSRLLGRLDALARELASRSASTNEPISLTGIPSEVAPLVKAMNALVGRLHHALDQQKRFLADAAHELRTPLAALQIQVDGLAASTPATIEERRAALTQGVRRASGLVNQLLHLARLDGPAPPTESEPVEVLPLLLSCVADHVAIAQRKGVDIGVGEQRSATVDGSAAELRVLIDNLIDNAVRYTPPEGTVDVSLRRTGDGTIIEIVDTGIGIPAEAESRVFNRFFRAASADAVGTGLGLAIVRTIADRHGLTVTVRNRIDGRTGVRAVVTLTQRPGHRSHTEAKLS